MMNSSLRFVNRLNSYCRRHVLKTVISKQPVRLLCTAIPEPHIDGQNENNRPRLVQLVEDIKKLTPVEVKDLNDLLKTNSNLRIDSSEPKKPRESREPREPRERIKDDSCVVRIRGLPYSASAEGVLEFFEGSNICGGESGIHLTQDDQGRPSGEAFIEFESPEDVEIAMRKHNADMDSRYIEVYRSNQNELDSIDCIVQLRGLPFSSDEEEIAAFFDGLEIVPNGIVLKKTRQGRNSGKAYVQFANPANADRSLCKHKETIGHRYIEIFRATVSEAQIAREQNKDQEY